jgi:hypothetical protein
MVPDNESWIGGFFGCVQSLGDPVSSPIGF